MRGASQEYNNQHKPRLFLIERLSLPLVLLALILRCFGYESLYIQVTEAVKRLKILSLLERIGVRQLDFETCENVDTSIRMVDRMNMVKEAMDSLIDDPRRLDAYAPLFPNVPDAGRFLYSTLYIRCNRSFKMVSLFAMWLESMRPGPRRLVVYIYRDPLLSSYLAHVGEVVVNVAPPSWLAMAAGRVRDLLKGLVSRLRKSRPFQKKAPPAPPPASKSRRVVFFPHKSAFYGDLFMKDHFYSSDEDSPLHPTNILHVEFQQTPEVQDKLKRQIELGMPVHIMSRYSILNSLRSILRFLKFLQDNRRSLRAAGALRSSLAAKVAISYLLFEHYDHGLDALPDGVEVALLGYDMLFPPELAMALKSRKIVTVAVQERMFASFMAPIHTFLIDHYLATGPLAKEAIEGRPNVLVQKIEPVGFVRSDMLHRYAAEADERLDALRKQKKLIVALDHHSSRDRHNQRQSFATNWTANKCFYEDILRLAVQWPEVHIIIRGKNADWMNLEFFQDIVAKIESTPNVEVNRDYTRLNVSYILCAKADLVIAKHTSLIDECIAVGKQVLVHDYTHNASSLTSCMYDYEGAPFFCHDFAALERSVARFLREGRVMDAEAFNDLRQRVFGGLSDGACSRRVREYVMALLEETSQNAKERAQ
jgi:hypothetical protein